MNSKTKKQKVLIWIVATLLVIACFAGITYELCTKTQNQKLTSIHIVQYAVMIFAVFIPILFESFKLRVGIIAWSAFYVFVFLAVFVGSILNIYDKFEQFDVIVHTLSGIFIALVAVSLATEIKNKFVFFVFVLSVAVLVGVLWEFYEFSFDKLLSLNMQRTADPITGEAYTGSAAIFDTMLDLVCDFSGGFATALFCVIFRHKIANSILITKTK